jgi:hypothetical protein
MSGRYCSFHPGGRAILIARFSGASASSRSQLRHASLTLVAAGHWLQIDEPERVATALLSTAGR